MQTTQEIAERIDQVRASRDALADEAHRPRLALNTLLVGDADVDAVAAAQARVSALEAAAATGRATLGALETDLQAADAQERRQARVTELARAMHAGTP